MRRVAIVILGLLLVDCWVIIGVAGSNILFTWPGPGAWLGGGVILVLQAALILVEFKIAYPCWRSSSRVSVLLSSLVALLAVQVIFPLAVTTI
ncbi:MAG: hypothetical protein HIU84_06760 [Acidobacteria bacterium]|nr:hypothetical protein [Acidobacteriota bacterium]